MKISIVIPVYNEVDSISQLYKELTDVLSDFASYEIFFIHLDEAYLFIPMKIEQLITIIHLKV